MKKDNNSISHRFKKVASLFEQQKEIEFTIIEGRNKGFLVKVYGLQGYLPYDLMPWHYGSLSWWKHISHSFKGKVLNGYIAQLEEDPIKIVLKTKKQSYTTPELQLGYKYKGIIIQKTAYGLFVELGIHYDWKYGSVVGLLHKSSFGELSSFVAVKEGQELPVTFHGYTTEGKIVLGGIKEKAKWATEEMEAFVGTRQPVKVLVIHHTKTFFVNGIHKALAPVTKLYYQEDKEKAKAYKDTLQDGQTILCEIVKISKKKDCFIIKLPVTA